MAQFARLDANNVVTELVQIDDSHLKEPINGRDEEILGIAYCIKFFGGKWKQTSPDMRVRPAKIGHTYNPELDAFIPPQPYPSWILNESIANWESPVQKPSESEIKEQESNGFILIWNEDITSWEFLDTKVLTEEKIVKINYHTSIQR